MKMTFRLLPRPLPSFASLVLAVVLGACSGEHKPVAEHAGHSPYSGMESRTIKALSDSEIEQLRGGMGMGLAMAAELNGLPGPKHVLELAEELALTDEQRDATQTVFDLMNTEARTLGGRLIEIEQSIDDALSDASVVDSALVRQLLMEASETKGRLRWSHIRAHVEQTGILTEEQRLSYVSLRGYQHEHEGH